MAFSFKNLRDMIQTQGERFGDKVVIRFHDEDVTYRELDERSSRVANALKRLGIRKGDRVCLLRTTAPNSTMPSSGSSSSGLSPAPSTAGGRPARSSTSSTIPARWPSLSTPLPDPLGPGAGRDTRPEAHDRPGIEADGYLSFDDFLQGDSSLEDVPIGPDDISTIVYTSGTTGNPKGVLLSHGNILTNSWQATKLADISEREVVMCFLPCSTSTASSSPARPPWPWAPRSSCGRISPPPTSGTPSPNTGQHLQRRPHGLPDSPEHPGSEKVDVSSLRYGVCGAAPMPVETIRRFEETFNMIIVEGYGLTEGTAGATANPINGVRKIGSIGIPFEDSEIRIVDDDDREVPQGEVGEITIRGGHVMKGYFNKPEETAQTLRGGWLHTGDMAYTDADGYLFIVDRKKEMIIRGGENIYPKELEGILFTHPKILEASVVGVPDPIYGEEVLACVVVRPGETLGEEELRDWCRENMASYKVPRYVDFRDSLPKNIIGKVLKKELRGILQKEGRIR